MRHEDWADVQNDETVLDLTPEQADQLRAEYTAEQAAKAIERQRERAEWFRQLARARDAWARGQTPGQVRELAEDVAWAGQVLVDGETFHDGSALYLALHNAMRAGKGRALGFAEIGRLRRLVVALTPERVAPAVSEVA